MRNIIVACFGCVLFFLAAQAQAEAVLCNNTGSSEVFSFHAYFSGTKGPWPGNNHVTNVYRVEILEDGIVKYFGDNGFHLPLGNAYEAEADSQYGNHAAFNYGFADSTYGANAFWSAFPDNGGMKVVARNPYTGNTVNWFFKYCQFQN